MQDTERASSTLYFSYSGRDDAFAFRLAADLKNAGFDLRTEQLDTQTNSDRMPTLRDELAQCGAMLPVLSANYVDTQDTWFELEEINSTINVDMIPILLHDQDLPSWIYQETAFDFSRWRNTYYYDQSLEQLIALLGEKFPAYATSRPSTEIRYLNSLSAEIEDYKAFLRTVSSRSDTLPTDKRAIYSQSLWGLTGEFEVIGDESQQTSAVYPFGEIMNKYPRFVLTGAAGAGKTTALYRTLLDLLRAYQASKEDFPLPLLINLGQWVENVSFETFFHSRWPLESDPDSLLAQGRVLLLLDGLDEIGAMHTEKVASLRTWLHGDNPARFVIVACTEPAYADSSLDLPVVHLREINASRIRQYVTQHLEDDAANCLLPQILPEDESERGSSRVAQLAKNAFYLAIVVGITQKMPNETLPDYEALLLKWLVETLWAQNVRDPNFIPFDVGFPALSLLAFSMIDDETSAFVDMEYALEKIGEEPILQTALDTGILRMYRGMVGFCHPLVRDYCATHWLMNEEGVYARLMQAQFTDEGERILWKWDWIVTLCSALAPNSDVFISAIAETNPYLALECISKGTPVSEGVKHDVTESLLAFLRTTDHAYAPQIIQILQTIHDADTVSTLLEYLHHDSRGQTRSENEERDMPLKKLGTDTVRYLINILKGDKWARRRGAAWALGEIREPAAIPSLIDALSDEDESVRKEADYALARIGKPALPRLLKALHDNDPDVRAAVIKVLGRIGDTRAVPDLVACLPDTSWPNTEEVRVCDLAAIALEHIGTDDALAEVDAWREQVRVAAANSEWHSKVRVDSQAAVSPARPLEDLIVDLARNEWSIRRDAVRALGEIGDDAALPHILTALKDEDNQVRWMAVKALDNFQSEAAIRGLLDALRDEDYLICDASASALGRRGETAVPGLVEALTDSDVNVRGNAAEALGTIRSASAIPHLADALQDTETPRWEEIRVCDIAAASLEKIDSEQARLALAKWHEDHPDQTETEQPPETSEPEEYASLLHLDYAYEDMVKDPSYTALVAFLDALQVGEWQDRRQASRSLQEYAETLKGSHDTDAITKLSQALNNEETIVRWTAAEALAVIGDTTATPALLEALNDESWTVRAAAVRALLEIESVDAIPGLLQSLEDENPLVREAAVATLGKIGDPSAAQPLAKSLNDEDGFVRRAAARVLGTLPDKSVVPNLMMKLDDDDFDVRWATIETLGKIGDPRAVPCLIEKLQDTSKPLLENQRMCDTAAEALETIGTPEALAAVNRWREEESSTD